jgi:alpha-L-arabinofuranosidase
MAAGADSTVKLTIRADQPGARIYSAMWGIFFEDINFGADGGLYAELVKNRSFEFPNPMMGWAKSPPAGNVEIRSEDPFEVANPHYLRLTATESAGAGVSNEGFYGMGVRAGEDYDFSAQVRVVSGSPAVAVELRGPDATVLARGRLEKCAAEWQKLATTLSPKATVAKAQLALLVEGAGVVDVDMVSLFPRRTWKERPGGLRADMVQKLADLKPGFMRFPGGCIVEGSELSRRYQWKKTIGPIEKRQLLINRWNYEFKHRPAPDYFQSFGLGFFEFFQLCEDIGAEPLPILNCGMACQFNSGQLVPMDQLDPYIQDALDLIEFANGPADSPWGSQRAAMGHPAPFKMKLLGVGNEQWGPQYVERYAAFARVLKQKHPGIALVAAAGPAPADDKFQFLWPKLRELNADIIDEHCYANPVWFLSNAKRYDNYDRRGPRVFMGEYAAQSVAIVSPDNRNNLECALAEAAFMTGLERNADVVRMSSYAPLFAHAEGWQWRPDLIWVDNLNVVATPNYYVQQFFMHHRGDIVLPLTCRVDEAPAMPAGGIGLGTSDTTAEFKDLRVTQRGRTLLAEDFSSAAGWSGGPGWGARQGVYAQTDPRARSISFAGDRAWSDYTVALKARFLAGNEGLKIVVRSTGPEDYVAWNIGGWRNEYHGLVAHLGQQDQLITREPGKLEPGQWYDVKVELKGAKVVCFLDGKLVHRAEVPVRRTPLFFASATRDAASGEIILKAVNPTGQPAQASLQFRGLKTKSPWAQGVVLSSANPNDENSFTAPAKVAPRNLPSVQLGSRHTFEPYSFTVLRIQGQ